MIVIVVAKLGEYAFEARVRNGTGPDSDRIPGIPTLNGQSLHDVVDIAKRRLKTSVVEAHGGVHIEVREDPTLTQ